MSNTLRLLKTYKTECETNVRALWNAEHYYKKQQRYMGLSSSILGWLGVFLGSLDWYEEGSTLLFVFFLLASGGSSLVQTVNSYLNLTNRITSQHTSGGQYNDLGADITLFLAQNDTTTEKLLVFLNQVHEVKDVYDATQPYLPDRFWAEARAKQQEKLRDMNNIQRHQSAIFPGVRQQQQELQEFWTEARAQQREQREQQEQKEPQEP